MKKFFITFGFLIFLSLFGIQIVFAADPPPPSFGVPIDPLLRPEGAPTAKIGQEEPKTPDEIRVALTQRIVNVILGIAGTVAVFFILNSGWYLAASGGQEEAVTQHKKSLMWAVIGLILIILSYSIIRFIISIPFQAQEVKTEQKA